MYDVALVLVFVNVILELEVKIVSPKGVKLLLTLQFC